MESDDGLAFDIDALIATVIREEMEYGGVRLKTAAYLERTRIPITIDMGFGEAMADATQRLDYPTLLDFPAPQVRSYPPASVIAEKFQAMVALGALNGRMKDTTCGRSRARLTFRLTIWMRPSARAGDLGSAER